MVDTHSHLNDQLFLTMDLEEVVNRAKINGVETIICNGGGINSSKRALEIAHRFNNVYATVGIHPEEAEELKKLGVEEVKQQLLDLAQNEKVVGIGEAGLDFFTNISEEQKQFQKVIFRINTWLGDKTGLPLVVHNRNADAEILELLKDFKQGVQLHCFVGREPFLNEVVNRKYFISFGGILTFKKSGYLREIAKMVPEDKLLIETDSPYLSPEPIRQNINEPANVKIVAKALAEIKGLSEQEVDRLTSANAVKLFQRLI